MFFFVIHEEPEDATNSWDAVTRRNLKNIWRPSVCLAGDRTRGRKVKEEMKRARGNDGREDETNRVRTTMERRNGGEKGTKGKQKEIKDASSEEHFSLDRGGAATV